MNNRISLASILGLVVSTAAVSSTAIGSPVSVVEFGSFYFSDGQSRTFDLNSDGIDDLVFAYNGADAFGGLGWEARVNGASAQADVRFAGAIDDDSSSVHTRLTSATPIGPGIDTGFSFGVIAYQVGGGVVGSGDWLDQQSRFVGFSFLSASGERHYGWAQVHLENDTNPDLGYFILRRIAYESEPGVAILAGDSGQGPQCNISDLDAPFGVLDLADIAAMISQKLAGTLDLTGDGLCDLADIGAFVTNFQQGCLQ